MSRSWIHDASWVFAHPEHDALGFGLYLLQSNMSEGREKIQETTKKKRSKRWNFHWRFSFWRFMIYLTACN